MRTKQMTAGQIADQIARLTAELATAQKRADRRDRKIATARDQADLLRLGSVADQAVAAWVYDTKVAALEKPTKTPRSGKSAGKTDRVKPTVKASAVREFLDDLECGVYTTTDVCELMGLEISNRPIVRSVMNNHDRVSKVIQGGSWTPGLYEVA